MPPSKRLCRAIPLTFALLFAFACSLLLTASAARAQTAPGAPTANHDGAPKGDRGSTGHHDDRGSTGHHGDHGPSDGKAHRPPPNAPDGLPVIVAGRESEILGLVKPLAMGDTIAPGWVFDGVDIQQHSIRYILKSGAGATTVLRLEHQERARGAKEKTKSFALVREPPPGGAPSPDPLDRLAQAVRDNDRTPFWPVTAPNDPVEGAGKGDGGGPAQGWRAFARDLAGDGVVLMLAALLYLFLHVRRLLREAPRWIGWTLAGIVFTGAALRLAMSRENLMEAWAYQRVAPLAGRMYHGPILGWLNRVAGGEIYLSDVIFKSNYLIAILSPLAIFAHARYILKDLRSALVAAFLLAFMPIHLRFSASDVFFIQSVATSSLTFVVLYTALTDRSRAWRWASFLFLPLLCTATYFLRPENIVFVALDLGAIYICTRPVEAPASPDAAAPSAAAPTMSRTLLAIVIVSGTALFAFVVNLLGSYRANVEDGLSFKTLQHALVIFTSGRLNTLINPWITPPGVTLLAAAGAYLLWRRGERPRSIFLVAWLACFFVVHSFVLPYHAAMQARYHVNLLNPLLLLAAAATPELLRQRPLVRWGWAGYLALSPLIHLGFIRDTDFNEMREYAFLTEARDKIPAGCTVLELRGTVDPNNPANQFHSRVGRVGERLFGGRPATRWKLVSIGEMPREGMESTPALDRAEVLTAEAKKVLDRQPTCLMFYQGLTCASLHPRSESEAAVCAAVRDRLDLTPVATARLTSRVYDPVNAGRTITDPSGATRSEVVLPEGSSIPIGLYRARSGP